MASDFIFRKASFGGFNRDDVINYINSIKSNEEKINTLLKEKESEIEKLKAELTQTQEKLNNKEIMYEEKLAELNDIHNNELITLKNEYEDKLQSGIIADRSAEERVGTAMLDVRRYADLLIHETCEKIDKMSDDADAATAKTLSRVLDISSGIQTFSDKLNAILKDILNENENICKELTGFKGTLRLPYDEAAGKIQADIFAE